MNVTVEDCLILSQMGLNRLIKLNKEVESIRREEVDTLENTQEMNTLGQTLDYLKLIESIIYTLKNRGCEVF